MILRNPVIFVHPLSVGGGTTMATSLNINDSERSLVVEVLENEFPWVRVRMKNDIHGERAVRTTLFNILSCPDWKADENAGNTAPVEKKPTK